MPAAMGLPRIWFQAILTPRHKSKLNAIDVFSFFYSSLSLKELVNMKDLSYVLSCVEIFLF